MAMLTIRNIEEDLKQRLRVRPARAGHSMQLSRILRDAPAGGDQRNGLGSRLHGRVLALTGGVDLAVPPRSIPCSPRDLDVDPP